jgi:hypothetical protein
LGALDLRGDHGLFSDISVKKKLRIGQQGRDAIEPSQSQERILKERLTPAV